VVAAGTVAAGWGTAASVAVFAGVAASSCLAESVWLTLFGVATTPATTPTPAVAAAAVPNVIRRARRAEAFRLAIASLRFVSSSISSYIVLRRDEEAMSQSLEFAESCGSSQ
jgi:hypothetical protein